VCSAALGASAPTEGGKGRGHIVAAACLYTACLFRSLFSNPHTGGPTVVTYVGRNGVELQSNGSQTAVESQLNQL